MSVYFVEAGPYVKIGHARDAIARAATVTTSGKRPSDLPRATPARLIGWVPGTTWDEGAWHARFVADRVAGEWFYLDPALIPPLIWADPAGIVLRQMTALAVFAACRHPDITREQIAAAGVQIEPTPFANASAAITALVNDAA